MKLLVVQPPKDQASPYKTTALIRRLHERDHTCIAIENRTAGPLAALTRTARVLRGCHEVDRVVVQDDLAAAAGAWLAFRVLRKPYMLVISQASSDQLRRWSICPWIVRSFFTRAQAALILNTATRDALLKFGVRRKHLELIPPPVDASTSAATTDPRRFISELLSDTPTSTAGLLRAFASLLETEPNCQLALHGPAAALAEAEQRVRAMGLEANVVTRDAPAFGPGRAGIAIAYCTKNEAPDAAFALDALGHGLPVVTVRHALLNDWLKDGETALLVPPGDEASLAEALRSLVRDPSRAQSLAQAARARFAARHSWDEFLDRLLRS